MCISIVGGLLPSVSAVLLSSPGGISHPVFPTTTTTPFLPIYKEYHLLVDGYIIWNLMLSLFTMVICLNKKRPQIGKHFC